VFLLLQDPSVLITVRRKRGQFVTFENLVSVSRLGITSSGRGEAALQRLAEMDGRLTQPRDAEDQSLRVGTLFPGPPGASLERWRLWKKRFGELGGQLGHEAKEAGAVMEAIERNAEGAVQTNQPEDNSDSDDRVSEARERFGPKDLRIQI